MNDGDVIESAKRIFIKNGINEEAVITTFDVLDKMSERDLAVAHAISMLSKLKKRYDTDGIEGLERVVWPTLHYHLTNTSTH